MPEDKPGKLLQSSMSSEQTKKKRNKGTVSTCALENAGILFSFLSVELKFWSIYNIMYFPLASKITTLKVYEKNMWWIYLPISESKTALKSRKMKSSCWKWDLWLEGTLEERKLNYSATFFVIERILEEDHEMHVSDGVYATS